ncbi:hypothetical protein DFH09DRAFT_1089197 [Mycena vulgaris]|nr:hypothetical protein DFH09DRAFT_1089197 [Mycena vulgaris]
MFSISADLYLDFSALVCVQSDPIPNGFLVQLGGKVLRTNLTSRFSSRLAPASKDTSSCGNINVQSPLLSRQARGAPGANAASAYAASRGLAAAAAASGDASPYSQSATGSISAHAHRPTSRAYGDTMPPCARSPHRPRHVPHPRTTPPALRGSLIEVPPRARSYSSLHPPIRARLTHDIPRRIATSTGQDAPPRATARAALLLRVHAKHNEASPPQRPALPPRLVPRVSRPRALHSPRPRARDSKHCIPRDSPRLNVTRKDKDGQWDWRLAAAREDGMVTCSLRSAGRRRWDETSVSEKRPREPKRHIPSRSQEAPQIVSACPEADLASSVFRDTLTLQPLEGYTESRPVHLGQACSTPTPGHHDCNQDPSDLLASRSNGREQRMDRR